MEETLGPDIGESISSTQNLLFYKVDHVTPYYFGEIYEDFYLGGWYS